MTVIVFSDLPKTSIIQIKTGKKSKKIRYCKFENGYKNTPLQAIMGYKSGCILIGDIID